jgi:hypothetical protein
MSALSSNTANSIISLPNFPTSFSVKLDEGNYMVWLSVIVQILKSHEVMGIVDGSNPCPPQFVTDAEGKNVPNPAYSLWVRQDQLLLGWLNITLSESILSTVFGLHTSNQVWSALKSRFASESRSRVSHLKRKLQNLNQGSKSCFEYLKTAKNWADQLAAIGKSTNDEDLLSYIISGLNPSYNSFITSYSIATRDKVPSFANFQEELLSHEMLLQKQQNVAPDTSTFALHMQKGKQVSQLFNKKKWPQFSRFSPRSDPS